MTHAFSISHHPHLSPSHTQTHTTDRQRHKGSTVEDTRGLTVLEGAAMVSISSWVTHTLPDGYRTGGGRAQETEQQQQGW